MFFFPDFRMINLNEIKKNSNNNLKKSCIFKYQIIGITKKNDFMKNG